MVNPIHLLPARQEHRVSEHFTPPPLFRVNGRGMHHIIIGKRKGFYMGRRSIRLPRSLQKERLFMHLADAFKRPPCLLLH